MVLFPLLYHVVPVLHCITTNDTCPTWIYKRYLRYVPPQFRVCGECVQELQFYQNRGRPFSYRQYAAPSYHSIHYGNEMHYRLFPQLAHNLGYRVLFMILTSGDERKERIIIRNNFRSLQSRFNVGYFLLLLLMKSITKVLSKRVNFIVIFFSCLITIPIITCFLAFWVVFILSRDLTILLSM